MTEPDRNDRYTGCLLGLAVGDALGAPLAFMRPEQIQIKHGTVREMLGGGWLLLRPGQYTLPTRLSMIVAASRVEKGALDTEDIAARYADLYRTGPKDAAGALRTALAQLADGVPAADAGRKAHELTGEESADNGTLCRAIPLALAHASDRSALLAETAAEARITHWDQKAAAASVALAVVLSFVLEGLSPRESFDRAWDWLEDHSREMPNVLPDVPAKAEEQLDPGSQAIDTLETALWQFLAAPSFEETVVRTANLGGESAVTTALAGALAGARYGASAIPSRWLRSLADRTVLRNLATDLLTKTSV
jgi:ADP-ribosyl-[dinitrogen reductase] hydrolase